MYFGAGAPMRIRWLKAALRNLQQEAEYIAQEDPAAALRVVGRIGDAVRYLEDHPSMGRAGRVPGTRELVVSGTQYIVPYRVRGQDIEILRVFHTARKWPTRI
jgi:addiction module RelE/StbE family toxin